MLTFPILTLNHLNEDSQPSLAHLEIDLLALTLEFFLFELLYIDLGEWLSFSSEKEK
jgi:hypothetical protein